MGRRRAISSDPAGIGPETMSLLPDGASLEEWVQDCFLAYRGSGVTLSALDAEILSRWAHSGAPFEVIARGIRRAARRGNRDPPAWVAVNRGDGAAPLQPGTALARGPQSPGAGGAATARGGPARARRGDRIARGGDRRLPSERARAVGPPRGAPFEGSSISGTARSAEGGPQPDGRALRASIS